MFLELNHVCFFHLPYLENHINVPEERYSSSLVPKPQQSQGSRMLRAHYYVKRLQSSTE